MTPLPAVNNVIRVDLIHKYGEDASVGSRFFMSYSGTPTQAQLTTMASNAGTTWGTQFKTLCSSAVALQTVLTTDLGTAGQHFGEFTTTNAGTRAGGVLTAETAAVVNFAIARRYRGGHSRVYLPFGTATDLQDPQTWNNTFLTAMGTGWTNFIAGVISGAGNPTLLAQVTVSYFAGGTWIQHQPSGAWKFHPTQRSTPLVESIVGTSVRLRPGSQRRRMLG